MSAARDKNKNEIQHHQQQQKDVSSKSCENVSNDSFLKRYQIIEKIGEGSYSEVLKCASRTDGSSVACKRLKRIYKSWAQVTEIAEIATLRTIQKHSNILQMIEIHYDEVLGKVSLVFELMDVNLYELIKDRKRPLPESRVRTIMFQLFRALKHLHKLGIFHRDIKPENILIKLKTDQLKLGDLGSVRGMFSRPPYTEYISTRWYRSPECLLTAGHYSYKMDIWAAGCVFYEVSTLRPLFPGSSEIDQINRINNILGTPPLKLLDKFRKQADLERDTYRNSTQLNRRQHIQKVLDGYSSKYSLASTTDGGGKSGSNKSLKSSKHNVEFSFPGKDGSGLDKILPSHMTREAKEIIKACLAYDPDHRPTAQRIIHLTYFYELRNSYSKNPEKVSSKPCLTICGETVTEQCETTDLGTLGDRKGRRYFRNPQNQRAPKDPSTASKESSKISEKVTPGTKLPDNKSSPTKLAPKKKHVDSSKTEVNNNHLSSGTSNNATNSSKVFNLLRKQPIQQLEYSTTVGSTTMTKHAGDGSSRDGQRRETHGKNLGKVLSKHGLPMTREHHERHSNELAGDKKARRYRSQPSKSQNESPHPTSKEPSKVVSKKSSLRLPDGKRSASKLEVNNNTLPPSPPAFQDRSVVGRNGQNETTTNFTPGADQWTTTRRESYAKKAEEKAISKSCLFVSDKQGERRGDPDRTDTGLIGDNRADRVLKKYQEPGSRPMVKDPYSGKGQGSKVGAAKKSSPQKEASSCKIGRTGSTTPNNNPIQSSKLIFVRNSSFDYGNQFDDVDRRERKTSTTSSSLLQRRPPVPPAKVLGLRHNSDVANKTHHHHYTETSPSDLRGNPAYQRVPHRTAREYHSERSTNPRNRPAGGDLAARGVKENPRRRAERMRSTIRDDVFCSSDDDMVATMRKRFDELISERARRLSESLKANPTGQEVSRKCESRSEDDISMSRRYRHDKSRKYARRELRARMAESLTTSYFPEWRRSRIPDHREVRMAHGIIENSSNNSGDYVPPLYDSAATAAAATGKSTKSSAAELKYNPEKPHPAPLESRARRNPYLPDERLLKYQQRPTSRIYPFTTHHHQDHNRGRIYTPPGNKPVYQSTQAATRAILNERKLRYSHNSLVPVHDYPNYGKQRNLTERI